MVEPELTGAPLVGTRRMTHNALLDKLVLQNTELSKRLLALSDDKREQFEKKL